MPAAVLHPQVRAREEDLGALGEATLPDGAVILFYGNRAYGCVSEPGPDKYVMGCTFRENTRYVDKVRHACYVVRVLCCCVRWGGGSGCQLLKPMIIVRYCHAQVAVKRKSGGLVQTYHNSIEFAAAKMATNVDVTNKLAVYMRAFMDEPAVVKPDAVSKAWPSKGGRNLL